MRRYSITELSDKVFETPAGVVIDGIDFKGVHLDRLMPLVTNLDDATLDAMLAFCRRLTMKQQQEALASWEE